MEENVTNNNLSNCNFLKALVGQNEFCKEMLEIILDKKFAKLECVEELVSEQCPDDAIVHVVAYDKEQSRYDVILHKVDRARTVEQLQKEVYSLKQDDQTERNYRIIITDDDLFDRNWYRYEFSYRCTELENIVLKNGRECVFLNLNGRYRNGTTAALYKLLKFMKHTVIQEYQNDTNLSTICSFLRKQKGMSKM